MSTEAFSKGIYSPRSPESDYYSDLTKLYIDQGGKSGDFEIPIGWLRMTLAGLEGRDFRRDEMWDPEIPDFGPEPPMGPGPVP